MEFLGLIVIIVIAVVLKRRHDRNKPALGKVSASNGKSQDNGESSGFSSPSESIWNHTKPPIPSGHQIYLKRLEVAGVEHSKDDVYRLAVAENPALVWKPDPDNEHDANAIAIYGQTGGQEFPVGFVDRKTAAKLSAWPDFNDLGLRFEKAGYNNGWVEIAYQVTGPKAQKKSFDEHMEG